MNFDCKAGTVNFGDEEDEEGKREGKKAKKKQKVRFQQENWHHQTSTSTMIPKIITFNFEVMKSKSWLLG